MNVEETFAAVRAREMDREFIQQDDLDVLVRERRSALPWRGQFTPGLVSKLIDVYYPGSGMVFDPFLGSGTTVLESIRRGIPSAGAEINPAALELAGILEIASLPAQQRASLIRQASAHFNGVTTWGEDTLFGALGATTDFAEHLLESHRAAANTDLARIFATTLLLSMGDKKETDLKKVSKSWIQVRELIADFPENPVPSRVIAADARSVPLENGCAGLIVTSPPYINVFNYHQNYRPAVERIGWNVLPAARTEIGSNRKNRQNRFLTVIQYCIDMADAIREMSRLIAANGSIVIVVGRESKVRGVPFSNSEIIASLAEGVAGMRFIRWQERKFVNRFGVTIFEDILSFQADESKDAAADLDDFARGVARHVLAEASMNLDGEVRDDMNLALDSVTKVSASPELTLLKV